MSPFSTSAGRENSEKHVIKTSFSEIECVVRYPEENPEGALRDITRALGAIGILDAIK